MHLMLGFSPSGLGGASVSMSVAQCLFGASSPAGYRRNKILGIELDCVQTMDILMKLLAQQLRTAAEIVASKKSLQVWSKFLAHSQYLECLSMAAGEADDTAIAS